MKYKIYNSECLEEMKNIPGKSIDMILCDLPYGTTRNKWDSIIPLEPLWEQYNRIIKDNGCIALFGQTPFDKILGTSNINMLKYEWIWEKNIVTGFLNAKKMPLKKHENILIFYKKPPTYNPIGIVKCEKKTKQRTREQRNYGVVKANTYTQTTTNYPKSILRFSHDKDNLHPTQKPVALLEYLIKTYTNEGETVLDNCMGSGSTGVACIHTDRDFIGIEKDKTYFELSKDRLRKEYMEKYNDEK